MLLSAVLRKTVFSNRKLIVVKRGPRKQQLQLLGNLLSILFLVFTTFLYELILPSTYGIIVTHSARLIDRINGSEIERYGVEANLTDHDRRSILNRIHENKNLMEIKYVISTNGTPEEICSLFPNKVPELPQQPIVENCFTVKRRSCNREFVLTNKARTIRDCEAEGLKETCITKTRKQLVQTETVLCENSGKLTCSDKKTSSTNTSFSDLQNEICHPNRLAICQKRPKIVTVTETQRLCGKEFQVMKYQTTKMCITHEHETDKTLVGEWKCLDFEHLYQRCLSFNVKKQIRSEIAQGSEYYKLECTHKGNFKLIILTQNTVILNSVFDKTFCFFTFTFYLY
jgi:hypothetical protein